MIPLSLYVTIELCKILQVYHIHNNIDMFDIQTNKRSECRAMNITEELGQVQHIFSDKTGTLTENKMLFRRCTVNGVDYNHPPSELEEEYSSANTPAPPVRVNPKFMEDLQAVDHLHRHTVHSQRIQEFFLVLTICNTVVVSATPHHDMMNASGMIETFDENGVKMVSNKPPPPTLPPTELNAGHSADRYTRLAESRSMTPSPPPLSASLGPTSSSAKHHQQHVPSLSPISSSAESTPATKSPQLKHRSLTRGGPSSSSGAGGSSNSSMSPTAKARTIITSKISTLTSILANKAHQKRVAAKIKRISPRPVPVVTPTADGRPLFEAESPDELALVNAAFSYDCCLVNRSPHHIIVNAFDQGPFEYEVLKVLPFDSSRKCMSVIVRRVGSQDLLLYTKGADSSIIAALSPCPHDSEAGLLRDRTQQQLDMYARQGLRVLVMGKRHLNPTDYADWWQKHQQIEMSVENRDKRIRDSYSLLERNLTLLGATGIEDRLQEGVPETIDALRAAGIAIWVLTGDKPETAINVAYSAKVFQPQMELLR